MVLQVNDYLLTFNAKVIKRRIGKNIYVAFLALCYRIDRLLQRGKLGRIIFATFFATLSVALHTAISSMARNLCNVKFLISLIIYELECPLCIPIRH